MSNLASSKFDSSNSSQMIKVPTRSVSQLSNYASAAKQLNKSRNKSQNSDLDLSTEWRQTQFKTISGTTPVNKTNSNKPTFDQTLMPRRNPSPNLTTSSEQAVKIRESTLEMDDEEKELFGLTNSDEKMPPFA